MIDSFRTGCVVNFDSMQKSGRFESFAAFRGETSSELSGRSRIWTSSRSSRGIDRESRPRRERSSSKVSTRATSSGQRPTPSQFSSLAPTSSEQSPLLLPSRRQGGHRVPQARRAPLRQHEAASRRTTEELRQLHEQAQAPCGSLGYRIGRSVHGDRRLVYAVSTGRLPFAALAVVYNFCNLGSLS